MGEVRIDPANDRSTLGVMNEFAFHGELHFLQGLTDLEVLSIRLSSLILRPLQHRHADPDCAFGPPVKNVRRTKLANVADVGDSFTYSFDFDDGWVHTITAENVIPVAPRMTLLACTDGGGAARLRRPIPMQTKPILCRFPLYTTEIDTRSPVARSSHTRRPAPGREEAPPKRGRSQWARGDLNPHILSNTGT
jgi:hypothetical protein